jgi:DNA-binding transcriptional LysR family regulator
MTISLDTLATIDLIQRLGSFGAAARELGRVPSALSYQIRRAEDALDLLIFDRRGRRAQLTPAGRALLEGGRALLRQAENLERETRLVATGWELDLAIAIDATIPFERLLPLVADFDRLGVPTRLRFSEEVLQGSWDALLGGRAALAIGAPYDAPAEAFGSERFGIALLGEAHFAFCVAPHHPLAQTAMPVEDAQIAAHRAVVVADSSQGLATRTTGVLPGQSTLSVSSFKHKLQAQLAGLGCGYLPLHHAAEHLASGRLLALKLASPKAPVSLRYAWRKSGRGRALDWWLSRLALARVRARLLAPPAPPEFPSLAAEPRAARDPARP